MDLFLPLLNVLCCAGGKHNCLRWALLFLMMSVVKTQWSALNYCHWLPISSFSEDEKVCLKIRQFATGGFELREKKYFKTFLSG